MAEETSTPSKPAPEAGEPPVERAPAAEANTTAIESAPETTKENETVKSNGSEEKSSENVNVPEEKTESAEAPAEEPTAPAELSDEKEPEAGAAAEAPAPEPNGTPASAKKAGGSKRKSTGAVPEHKSKLSRKKSQIRLTHLHAKPGEYYLARLRSFPPWPSIICDEEILPETLLSTRPVTAMRADGTYREDYADGGKRAHERTFPVMFFETNEFAWIPNTDLTPLEPASCKDVSEKGKSKLLIAAYKVASEGNDLQHFKSLLADHQRAVEQENEEKEAEDAAKAKAKAEKEAKKSKRKSMNIVDDVEDADMEDVDEAEKPKSSRKRKKDTEPEEESEKPAKTPKTATKLKLTTPKTPTTETGKKTAGGAKDKQPADDKKADKAGDEGEEDASAAAKEPEKPIDQAEAMEKKQKDVLLVRHRLQKGFIARDKTPKEDEMVAMSGWFTKLEKVADDLEVSIIRSTKINKVLKMILKLSSIPRDEEFHFRKRAIDILSKWKNVLDTDTVVTPAGEKEKEEKQEEKPKANGVHKEDSVEAAAVKAEEKEEAKPAKEDTTEPLDEPMTDADAAEKVQAPEPAKEESEKEAPKAEEVTENKPTEEKAEEKTVEAAA